VTIAGYEVHPAAAAFPLIEGTDFEEFVEDVRENGQQEKITLYNGAILDGRNRARACEILGIKPKTRTAPASVDPWDYVISLNLARRHMSESQRAMVAARLANMAHGGDRRSSGRSAGRTTQAEAAKAVGSSERATRQAQRVLRDAEPELIEAVDQGHVAVSLAEKLAKRSPAEQRRVAKEAKDGKPAAKIVRELNRDKRASRMASISQGNAPMDVTRQYGVIIADPAWQYAEGTTTPNRKIENQYPTMTLEEICALPVRELALPDAVLALWVTSPLFVEVVEPVLKAWDFQYKSQWIWHKTGRRGTGYWGLMEHEIVVIAKRGDAPPPSPDARFPSVFSAPVGDHSAKPDQVHRRLELAYPKASKVELFCRNPRKGWDAWGNQANGDAP